MTTEQESHFLPSHLVTMLSTLGPCAYIEIPAPQKSGQTAIIVWAIDWDDEAGAWAVHEYVDSGRKSGLIASEHSFLAALTHVARLFALSQNG